MDDLVERLRADDPSDYRERHEEMLTWTGSAFLAGEDTEFEDNCKSELYSFLCGTLGYLVAAEVTARNGLEAADRIEKLEEVLKRLLETTANNAIYHSTDHAEARAVARATLSDNRGVTK